MYNGPMKSILEFSRKHPIITAIEAVLFCMASLLIIRPNAAVEGYGIADVLLRCRCFSSCGFRGQNV